MLKYTKSLLTLSLTLGIGLLLSTKVDATYYSCDEALPGYTYSDDSKCMEDYNECLEEPYTYTNNNCSAQCNEQYPNRINWLQAEGCYNKGDNYYEEIISQYENEFSTQSATTLANWCKCLRDCRDESRVPIDCEAKLEVCCSQIGERMDIDQSSGNGYSDGRIYYENTKADPNVDYEDYNTPEEEEKYFTVTKIKGSIAEVVPAGTDEMITVEKNMIVSIGDTVYTGPSTEIYLSTEYGRIVVPQNSSFTVSEYSLKDGLLQVQIKLFSGSMGVKVQPEKGLRAKFSIKTPTSTIGVRGTIFTVSYDETTGETVATAYEHDIDVTNNSTGEKKIVYEGNYAKDDGKGVVVMSPSSLEPLSSEYDEFFDTLDSPSGVLDVLEDSFFMMVMSFLSGVVVLASIGGVVFTIAKKKKGLLIISIIVGGVSTLGLILSLLLYSGVFNESSSSSSNSVGYWTDISTRYENIDGKFSFEVGDLMNSVVERRVSGNVYVYCYPQVGVVSYDGSMCLDDEVPIFTITQTTEDVYFDYLDFGYEFVLLENTYGIAYLLEVPNGELPKDVQPITEYIDLIEESFELE